MQAAAENDKLEVSMDVVIKTSTSGSSFIISIDGELDMYTAPRLKDALGEGVAEGYKKVVVDLTRVGFLDSTTLGILVGGLRRLRSEEGELHLVVDHPHLAKMFRITGFDGVFSIHKTVDEAVAAGSPAS
jgi:anti-sigma B factor antagonist